LKNVAALLLNITGLVFPQRSTGKFHPPQFVHKGREFFYCWAQLCASEWVHRKRWIFWRAETMDLRQAGGRPVILEGELPGEIGNARAYWLPGHCGLLHFSREREVLLASAEQVGTRFSNRVLYPAGKCGVLYFFRILILKNRERCRTGTVVSLS
jgi:hypothetical protein